MKIYTPKIIVITPDNKRVELKEGMKVPMKLVTPKQ